MDLFMPPKAIAENALIVRRALPMMAQSKLVQERQMKKGQADIKKE